MINSGQYGSVPGRTAVELVMLNQISNDICRTNKYNIIRFDNDASACYDRILVHFGMMAARRCGMPENAIRLHANTLERMQYKVKTAFGTSDTYYTGAPGRTSIWNGSGKRCLTSSMANAGGGSDEHVRPNYTRPHQF
jgi:hypothetical protein